VAPVSHVTPTALGSATTGSDGTFSLAVTLPALGLVRATFAGDSAYAPANGSSYATPAYLPAKVSLDPLPAIVSGLTHLTVTGSAQMQAPGGTWVPAADTGIIVHGSGTNYRASTQTDANGRFTASFWVEDPGPLEADSTQGIYSFAGAAQSAGAPVTINPTPTQVTGFQATSAPEIAQNGLGFSGHVDAWATDSGSSFRSGANMEADLYFQAQGQTSWTEMASSRVVFPDIARFGLPAYLPDGQLAQGSWQVRVPTASSTNTFIWPTAAARRAFSLPFALTQMSFAPATAVTSAWRAAYESGGRPVSQQYIFGDREEERRRLDAQASLLNPATERFFRASGIGHGMRVLDLGSGAGHVAVLASRLVGPGGSVLGAERDPAAVAGARGYASAAGARNIEFVEGDVKSIDGIDGEYDAVVGRLIVMYLPDPAAALRRAAALLRPGGVLAVQEPDLTYDWASPMTPLWAQVRDWFLQTLERAGIEPRMGLRLHHCFRDAGLPALALSLEAAVLGGPDAPVWGWASLLTGVLPLMERLGVATVAEVGPATLASRLLAETVASEGVVITPPMIAAAARTDPS
jgi:SAM-dependent methyltransferase